jgi:hypothetical protein
MGQNEAKNKAAPGKETGAASRTFVSCCRSYIRPAKARPRAARVSSPGFNRCESIAAGHPFWTNPCPPRLTAETCLPGVLVTERAEFSVPLVGR